MASIALRNISKSYGTTRVINDVNIDIVDGEFLTLVGPSGCGKSTTLRIIAGLETQDGGDVEIDDQPVNKIRPSRRDLAMVFQSYALYPHLNVRQNLATPLMLRDLDFWERLPLIGRFMPGRQAKVGAIDTAIRETAETLKIQELLNRKPGQLSGGQRQRVALGRAMVRKPAAFLMDEPLSNLDAGLRVHMRAELAELHRSLGTTFVYVTHDQAEALTMSSRMAVMMDGDMLQIGEPSEVYDNPDDIRVAEFIGSPKINILPAEADASGRLTSLDVAFATGLAKAEGIKNLSVGLRPEHLHMHDARGADCFPGRLAYKENLGSDVYLHVVVRDDMDRMIVRAKPHEADGVAIGDELWIGSDPGKALFFGNKGERLVTKGDKKNERVA